MGEVARVVKCWKWCIFAPLAFVPGTSALAQTESPFEVIQWTDSGWYSARISGGVAPDDRYRVVDLRQFDLTRGDKSKAIIRSGETFLVDCKKSKGIKRMQVAFNLEPDPDLPPRWGQHIEDGFDKPFKTADVEFEGLIPYALRQQKEVDRVTEKSLGKTYPPLFPVPSTLAAEFACRVSSSPTSAAFVAGYLLRTGALTDLKEAACEIDFEGRYPPLETTLRFDESLGAAQFQGIWKRYVTVSPGTVKFKDTNFTYTISRTSGLLSMDSIREDGVTFKGNCVSASDRPRKF